MGHAEIDQTAALAADRQPNPALMQVLLETHGRPGDTPQTGTAASTNIEHRGSDDMSINQFENGVKFGTGNGVMSIEAPLGGRVEDKSGSVYGKGLEVAPGAHGEGTVVYDAHNKVVAEVDKNNVMHVHTKNGEYSETADGKVTFKPASGVSDLSTLHHKGNVSSSKLEDYGITTNSHTTRFGNGVEYNASTGHIQIPSEYPNFQEEKKYDDNHRYIGSVGTDGNGKTLYTLDAPGLHVPTADGPVTQNSNGAVRFEPARKTATTLPSLTIEHGKGKPEEDCFKSNDPICGLDLDGKF